LLPFAVKDSTTKGHINPAKVPIPLENPLKYFLIKKVENPQLLSAKILRTKICRFLKILKNH